MWALSEEIANRTNISVPKLDHGDLDLDIWKYPLKEKQLLSSHCSFICHRTMGFTKFDMNMLFGKTMFIVHKIGSLWNWPWHLGVAKENACPDYISKQHWAENSEIAAMDVCTIK